MSRARRLGEHDLGEIRELIEPASERLPSFGQLMYWAYLVALFGSFFVYAFVQSSGDRQGTDVLEAAAQVGSLVFVALGAGVLVAGLRFGTWAGPVLLSRADASWLLSAPVDRRQVVRPHLVGAGAAAVVVGVIAGLVSALTLAPYTTSSTPRLLAVNLVCWVALTVQATALAWLVESDHRLARLVVRLMPVAVGFVALLALAASSGHQWVLWTGPWGWFAVPLLATMGDPRLWPAALGLLVATASLLVAESWRRATVVHTEELRSRAGSRNGLISSMALGDFRTVAVLRRDRITALSGIRQVHLPLPRSSRMAIAWRDAVSLLRFRARTTLALVAVAGGGLLLLSRRPNPWVPSVAGALAAYWGTTQLLEPMRLETDDLHVSRLLPWSPARIVGHHVALPATIAILVTGTVVSIRLVLVGGSFDVDGAASLVLATSIIGLVVAAAVASAMRGDPPIHLLAYGEYGLMALLTWLFMGPLIVISVTVPVVLMATTIDATGPSSAITYGAATATTIAVALVAMYIVMKLRRLETS